MWKTLTTADNYNITPMERDAVQRVAIDNGVADPLPDIISDTVALIRGRVAVKCTLGSGETIPDELEGAAKAIIRHNYLSYAPNMGLVDAVRKSDYDNAMALLRDVARGLMAIVEPEVQAEKQPSGHGSTLAGYTKRRATRASLNGL